jgi:hypothetical protein
MLGEFNIPHVRVYKEQQTMRVMSASPPSELVNGYRLLLQRKPEKPFQYGFPKLFYKLLNNAALHF